MDFTNPWIFIYGSIITIGVYLIRPLAVNFIFRKDKSVTVNERTFLEILIPKGLAAAILSGIAIQSGLLNVDSDDFVSLVLSVIFLSIVLTSILIFFTEKEWFKGFFPFMHNGKQS